MRSLPVIIFISIILTFLSACDDQCGNNKNAIPLAGFYEAGESDSKVSVDSLTVRGINAPNDSIWSMPDERKTQLYLPFKIDSDTTEYLFSINMSGMSMSSTVKFIYSRTPRFTDASCGVSYIFDIKKIECSGSLIDSVTCPTGFIDNRNIENLRIYLNPNPQYR